MTRRPVTTKFKVAKAPSGHDLPDYIVARNRLALSGGLQIEKQLVKNNRITTVYRGLPEAFLDSGLVKDREEFLRRVIGAAKSFDRYCMRLFSPADCDCWLSMHRTDGKELRATITRERFPVRVWAQAPGVTAYEFAAISDPHMRWGAHFIGYVCERSQPLIDMGIAPATAFEPDHEHSWWNYETADKDDSGYHVFLPIWEVSASEEHGYFVLRHFPDNAERARREQEFNNRRGFQNPEEFRQSMVLQLRVFERIFACSVETKRGYRYALSDEVREEIEERIDDLVAIIEQAHISVSRLPDCVDGDGKPKLRVVANQENAGGTQELARTQVEAKILRLVPRPA